MPPSLTLRSGSGSEAVLFPSRGGLLAGLTLATPEQPNTPVPVLWLPESFSATESGWPGGGMPLLFPFAGRQFHGEQPLHYSLGGQAYHMPLHGFAYALPWTVTKQDASSAELTLTSGEASYQLFPFDFTLRARYTLSSTSLHIAMRVVNNGGRVAGLESMPVAMGSHPYFRAPLSAGSSLDQCRLETSAATMTRVTPVGLAGKSAPFPEHAEKAASLNDPIFKNLILGEHAQPSASLVDGGAKLQATISWSPAFRYLVLWSQEGKGFHCIEPWMGLPNVLHNTEGLRWLGANEALELETTIALAAQR